MFRTEIKLSEPDILIGLKTAMLSMGSCFANEMGQKMADNKFNISTNPAGILFNPLSIFRVMELALKDEHFPEWSYTKREGMYVSYLMHSDWAAEDQKSLEIAFNELLRQIRERLTRAEMIILTFGTAYVYQLKENGEIVANCHKVPQAKFAKRLLNQDEITKAFESIKNQIEAINPTVNFLLTVSPVRHTKEGLANNQLSKSILRLVCHELTEAHKNVSYFPAYEMMMDDLRDYRYYKKDLIHPNEQALDYIWERFSGSWFDREAQAFIRDWTKIRTALHHTPFNQGSDTHQQFLRASIKKLQNFSELVDVSEEMAYLQGQLNPA